MSKIDPLVKDFLAQKKIAVVGVSDKRETGCNLAYRKFKDAGYAVSAVHPRLSSVSPRAVEMCRENGISVIPGACPNQFLKPDFGHALMRIIFRTLGFHS